MTRQLKQYSTIWRLYIKQQGEKPYYLPIVIPLLVCHAKKEWPDDTVRLASLLSGPVEDLTEYIPDLQQKLPGILALLKTLMEKETGLQWLEVVIRYLTSVRDEEDLSAKKIVEMAEQAISKETGEYVMTLLEKLQKEGEERGLVKGEKRGIVKGKQEGLKEAIEMGITLKFPGDIESVMAEVNKIDDPETLKEITKTIYTANDISEILALLK
jgi:hypothetical protein